VYGEDAQQSDAIEFIELIRCGASYLSTPDLLCTVEADFVSKI